MLTISKLFGFEACILNYIGSLAHLKKEKDIIPSFKRLLAEIKMLSAHPIDREFPWREFYTDWLEKKIAGAH
jgi:hypothetical protein